MLYLKHRASLHPSLAPDRGQQLRAQPNTHHLYGARLVQWTPIGQSQHQSSQIPCEVRHHQTECGVYRRHTTAALPLLTKILSQWLAAKRRAQLVHYLGRSLQGIPQQVFSTWQTCKTEDWHHIFHTTRWRVSIRSLGAIQRPLVLMPPPWCFWLTVSPNILQWARTLGQGLSRYRCKRGSHGEVNWGDEDFVGRDGFQQLPLVKWESHP